MNRQISEAHDEPGSIERDLLGRAARLRVHRRRNETAPHKPLLLLLAVSRARHGAAPGAPWSEWREALVPLLLRYTPASRSRPRPEYPFRRLITDGLWKVDGFDLDDASQFVKGPERIRDFRVSWLNNRDPRAGLPSQFEKLLASDALTRERLVELLLQDHFERALRPAILRDTGLVP